jgi:hypothetical protein
MISIITPTMWRYKGFPENIEETLKESIVDEYIIINNDVSATPKNDILSHPKIKMYNFSKNIFVNPAWNFGAKTAKNTILAFLSDDVEFDSKIFIKTYDLFQKTENVGIVGVLTKYYDETAKIYEDFFTDGSIEFLPRFPTSTFGALFFMLKEQWKPIPEDLLVMNGECLQFNRCQNLGKNNFMAVNCRSESPWHVTLNLISFEMREKDSELYRYINGSTDWTRV